MTFTNKKDLTFENEGGGKIWFDLGEKIYFASDKDGDGIFEKITVKMPDSDFPQAVKDEERPEIEAQLEKIKRETLQTAQTALEILAKHQSQLEFHGTLCSDIGENWSTWIGFTEAVVGPPEQKEKYEQHLRELAKSDTGVADMLNAGIYFIKVSNHVETAEATNDLDGLLLYTTDGARIYITANDILDSFTAKGIQFALPHLAR